ncbi:hypothetical protein JCM24511_00275 [Saitozyma sp. JCM 24511]|nr:hypothetical protein JCM24511_00275 [Saitozyma sp. JCM 24511]
MAEGVIERPVQAPRTSEYDVLSRKRKRAVRFNTPRSGGEAGTSVAPKPKNLGAYRPLGKVRIKVEPGIGGTVQGSEEFPIDLTED